MPPHLEMSRWPWHYRLRSHLGIWLLRAGLWTLPPCKYRAELSEALWVLSLRVQMHVAVIRHRPLEDESEVSEQ